jgi:uncharacterized membrane protein
VALESLTEPVEQGKARSASADGSIIVGSANLASGGGAFRWTAAEGIVALGLGPASTATGVSSAGTAVVGTMYGPEASPLTHAFRWTPATGAKDLLSLGSGGLVAGVSADGTVIAGSYSPATSSLAPFRWTQSGLLRLRPDALGETFAISLDGSTLVGRALVNGEGEAFRYSNSDGYSSMALGTLTHTAARAVNGDGSLIAGYATEGAWIWDAINGVRLFTAVLAEQGANLDDWSEISIYAISSDGKVLAGDGYRKGTYTSWVAYL